jgi:hypothetical protein
LKVYLAPKINDSDDWFMDVKNNNKS